MMIERNCEETAYCSRCIQYKARKCGITKKMKAPGDRCDVQKGRVKGFRSGFVTK